MPQKQVYANYGRQFIPLSLRHEASQKNRSSILGAPPHQIRPAQIEKETRYFATLGLEGESDVSIFTTFDFESTTSRFNVFDGAYTLHDQSNPLLQFIVHKHTDARDLLSPLRSESPALAFIFREPGIDPEYTESSFSEPNIYEYHKTGGLPFFLN